MVLIHDWLLKRKRCENFLDRYRPEISDIHTDIIVCPPRPVNLVPVTMDVTTEIDALATLHRLVTQNDCTVQVVQAKRSAVNVHEVEQEEGHGLLDLPPQGCNSGWPQ